MHIVLDARSIHAHMGGIGRAALQLTRHLGRRLRGHRLTAIVGSNLPEGLSLGAVETLQVEAAMIDEPFEQLHLPNVLAKLRADVYINTTFSIPAIKTCPSQVSVIHDVVFEEHTEWVEPRLGDYLRKWSRFAAAHADRVVTVSDHAKSRIEKVYGLPPSRVTRIHNAIDAAELEPCRQTEIDAVKSRLHLASRYLLYLGTLEPKKGTPELIEAFSRLTRRGYAGQLVLAGGGGGGGTFDLESALAKSGARGRIVPLGYVQESDKKALIQGSDLFVYPSRYEGFGIPPLEAMALGVPTVVSNATSLPEVVGDAAIQVDVTDADAFVVALQRGLTDAGFRARARTAGPRQARRFSWERSAGEFRDLCESLGAA